MRASILVLGPLLARDGPCRWCRCPAAAPSARGRSICTSRRWRRWAPSWSCATAMCMPSANGGLKGAVIDFPFVSVGATENVADGGDAGQGHDGPEERRARARDRRSGRTACARWARRSRARAPSTITIQGVDRLHGATHRVVTDRIELGTYMLAPAISGGEVECLGGRIDLVGALLRKAGRGGHRGRPKPSAA